MNAHVWSFAICVVAIVFLLVQIHVFGGVAELYKLRLGATDADLPRYDATIARQRDFLSTGVWLSLFLFLAVFLFYTVAMFWSACYSR